MNRSTHYGPGNNGLKWQQGKIRVETGKAKKASKAQRRLPGDAEELRLGRASPRAPRARESRAGSARLSSLAPPQTEHNHEGAIRPRTDHQLQSGSAEGCRGHRAVGTAGGAGGRLCLRVGWGKPA